jgi:hypothetical protein
MDRSVRRRATRREYAANDRQGSFEIGIEYFQLDIAAGSDHPPIHFFQRSTATDLFCIDSFFLEGVQERILEAFAAIDWVDVTGNVYPDRDHASAL